MPKNDVDVVGMEADAIRHLVLLKQVEIKEGNLDNPCSYLTTVGHPWPPLTTLDHPQGRIFPGKLERIFQLFNFNLFEKYQLTDELYPTLTTLDQSSSPFTPL